MPELSDTTMRSESNWSKTWRPPIFLCDSGTYFCMHWVQWIAPSIGHHTSYTTFPTLGFRNRPCITQALLGAVWCGLVAHKEINQSGTVWSRAKKLRFLFSLWFCKWVAIARRSMGEATKKMFPKSSHACTHANDTRNEMILLHQ